MDHVGTMKGSMKLLPDIIELCDCVQLPCFHFTTSDYAMLCEKTANLQRIIKNEFNFATFTRNVCKYLCPLYNLHEAHNLMEIAQNYGANVNDFDPENGKTAFHYSGISLSNNINIYDFDGLSADAYHYHSLMNSKRQFKKSSETKLRTSIKDKSEKLFQFLFFDKVPHHWNAAMMTHIAEWELDHMNEKQLENVLTQVKDDKGNTLLHVACKMNNVKVTEFILQSYPKLQHVKNAKGKIAKEYAKECLYLFGNLMEYNSKWQLMFKREILETNPLMIYDLKEIILHFDSETIFQFSSKARDFEGNNVWHSYTVWFNENPEQMDEIFRHFDPTIINDKNAHDITPLQMAKSKLVFNKLVGYGARVTNWMPKQNNPNLIHLKDVYLCECQLYPCAHFTLSDHAMVCEKNDYVREVLRMEFNFAVFVKHLIRKKTIHRTRYMEMALDYGFDINQRDPKNGKTALDYTRFENCFDDACFLYTKDLYGDSSVEPSIDINTYTFRYKGRNEKVSRYLFYNEMPTHWSDTMINSLCFVKFKHIPSEKCRFILQNVYDKKGNNILHLVTKYSIVHQIFDIIRLEPSLAQKRNMKGKLPIAYAKNILVFQMLSHVSNECKWYRKLHFTTCFPHDMRYSPFIKLTLHYPELVEIVLYDKPTLVHNMDRLKDLLLVLSPEYIFKISKRAYDMAFNNIWHHYANCDPTLANNIFPLFDKSIINNRNVNGDTPLHLCKNEFVKQMLIDYGAHRDCLNRKNEMACNIVLNLQCIAARSIKNFEYVPYHLKDFIRLHHPE